MIPFSTIDEVKESHRRNDLLYRRWFSENIVRFYGGPMNGNVLEVDRMYDHLYIACAPVMQFDIHSIDVDKIEVPVARYRRIVDTFIVYPQGMNILYAYVFSGMKHKP